MSVHFMKLFILGGVLSMKRKRRKRETDQALLDAIFHVEAEWKKLQDILEHSIEPMEETTQQLQLAESVYMFLLREAKHRKISLLRY